jgi:hypothetical protein
MEAGRELDALIAEKVMGIDPTADDQLLYDKRYLTKYDAKRILAGETSVGIVLSNDKSFNDVVKFLPGCPHYSTDIAAAWQVVEKMEQRLDLCWLGPGDVWVAVLGNGEEDYQYGDAMAPTAPLAICRAALKAIGEDNG